MSGTMRAVTFPNRDGHQLFGILHEPAVPREDLAVVLLSPGVKSRVAPHRMYNKLAAMLVARGVRVLRFDFYGLGDSGGTITDKRLADFYGSVQVGRYADDTRVAIDWAIKACGVPHVVLGGLCGGAITGLLAGAEHPRVAGLLSLGIPVILDGSNIDKTRYMSTGQLRGLRAKYLDKILDPRAWARVLSLKTDFRLLYRAVLGGRPRPAPARAADGEQPQGNVNPHFRPAFVRMLKNGRPVLLIFSGSDRLYWEYLEKYADPCRAEVESLSGMLDVRVVDHANHVFTFSEWQHDMLDLAGGWFDHRFPTATAKPALAGSTVAATRSAHS